MAIDVFSGAPLSDAFMYLTEVDLYHCSLEIIDWSGRTFRNEPVMHLLASPPQFGQALPLQLFSIPWVFELRFLVRL